MTFIGDLLGYDDFGADLFGINRDLQQNCLVCGRSVYHHSREQEMLCLSRLYSKPNKEGK